MLHFATNCSSRAVDVSVIGYVDVNQGGDDVDVAYGVRPALYLNLASSDLWFPAGTVCRDEMAQTVDEPEEINLSDSTVTLDKTSYTYDGTARKPAVTVKVNSKTLSKNTDYTVAYRNNTKAGKAIVTITGKGDYTGTKFVTFRISPASLAGKKLVLTKATYTYNAKVQKPTVKTVGGKKLKAGTDYTVKITNNKGKTVASPKAAGIYSVTVTDKGNYTGTSAKATYKINKAANPLTVKAKTATLKFSAVKKKAQTLAVSEVLAVSKNQGKVTYAKASGNAKITINKTTGKVTVKKGLKKGSYKVKTKVTAAGNANYKAVTKTVTFKVKVN